MAAKTSKAKTAAPKTEKAAAVVAGPTSGVMAPGPAGKAAREAARATTLAAPLTGWRDPNSKYADDDNSIDARMRRLEDDLIEQGARPK